MDERAKKVVAILLAPKIGMRVRLRSCDHPHHFGNIPLYASMINAVVTIQEIAPAEKVYRKGNEVGVEAMAYKMAFVKSPPRSPWWVYRHQFEIIVDDDE
jgi:hypothetical protein